MPELLSAISILVYYHSKASLVYGIGVHMEDPIDANRFYVDLLNTDHLKVHVVNTQRRNSLKSNFFQFRLSMVN